MKAKIFVKSVIVFLFFFSCQKKKIFQKEALLDPKVEKIKKNYTENIEAQQLGLNPDWQKTNLHSNTKGWASIPIGDKVELIVPFIDQNIFTYRKILYAPDGKENVTLIYDATGILQGVIHQKNGRRTLYTIRAMARDYGFHHLNSRETKYNNWADFDFSDFEWIDVDKPEVLQNYLMIPKDLVIPPSCSNILMQVALLPAPIYDPNFPIVQLVQKQCDHYTHLLSIVGLASCHPSLAASTLTLATLYCEQAEALSKPPKKVPCPGDPMIDLAIAPTTIGSIKGGRWGIGNRTDEKLRPKNHKGIDLKAQINSSFVAMYKGTVENAEYIEKEPNIKDKPCYIDPKDGICKGDWGNFIKINSTVSGKEIITLYGHLNQMEVKKGQIVQQGDVLGLTGITGNASSNDKIIPHLHVEIEEKINGVWIRVDPEKYLSTKFDAVGNKDPNTGNCKQ